jgi:hypothetical protein
MLRTGPFLRPLFSGIGILMLVILLAACGGSNNPTPSTPKIPQSFKTLVLPYANGNQHVIECSKSASDKTYCSSLGQAFAVVAVMTGEILKSDNNQVTLTQSVGSNVLRITYSGLTWPYPGLSGKIAQGTQLGAVTKGGHLSLSATFNGIEVSPDLLWSTKPPSWSHYLTKLLGGFYGDTGLEHFCPLADTQRTGNDAFAYHCLHHDRDPKKQIYLPIDFHMLCQKVYGQLYSPDPKKAIHVEALNEDGTDFGWDCYTAA